MVYLNLYIAHVQLILNCSGTCTVWPEFITGAFINSFLWSGCTKGLWGRETWVFAEKIMSRGLRACLRGQLYVSLCMSASSEAHCILSGQRCCLQVSAVGTWWGTPCSQNSCPVRQHVSCSSSEVAWDELKAGHVLFSEYFQQKATPEPLTTAIPQHIYETQLGAFSFNETSRMFFTMLTLSPSLRPAETPCHVSLCICKSFPPRLLWSSNWYLHTDTSQNHTCGGTT